MREKHATLLCHDPHQPSLSLFFNLIPLRYGFYPYSARTSPSCCQILRTVFKSCVLCWIHWWLYCFFWSSCLSWLCVSTLLPITTPFIVILFPLYLFFIDFLKAYLVLQVFLKCRYYLDLDIFPLLMSHKTLSHSHYLLTILPDTNVLTKFKLNISGHTSLSSKLYMHLHSWYNPLEYFTNISESAYLIKLNPQCTFLFTKLYISCKRRRFRVILDSFTLPPVYRILIDKPCLFEHLNIVYFLL